MNCCLFDLYMDSFSRYRNAGNCSEGASARCFCKRRPQKTRDRSAGNYAECINPVHHRSCGEQGSEQLQILIVIRWAFGYNIDISGVERVLYYITPEFTVLHW